MKNTKILSDTVIFGTGAYGYGLIETVYRGYTHPSMFLAGGICLLSLAVLSQLDKIPFIFKCLLGGAIITAVEFVFGCIFNLGLGMDVWDYSDMPYNILGQVCPLFFGIWSLASAAGLKLVSLMMKHLDEGLGIHKKIPRYT